MGLNLSNHHMAQALDRNKDDVHQMTRRRRQGMVTKKPYPTVREGVECDEVDMVAGHKGKPDEVVNKGDADGADGSRTSRDEGRLPPRNVRSSG